MALTKIDDRGLKTPIDLLDNEKIRFGTGNDLELFHDGSHSIIEETGTGALKLVTNSSFQVRNDDKDTGEYIINANVNGSVELYDNGSKKFHTHSTGVTVTGYLHIEDGSTAIGLGNSDDLQLYHDGSNSYIDHDGAGDFYIRAESSGENIYIKAAAGIYLHALSSESGIDIIENGAVNLYYDNNKKLETTLTGIKVIDLQNADTQIAVQNNVGIVGSIYGDGANDFGLLDGQGHWTVKGIKDGAVELFHDHVKSCQTDSNGLVVYGPEGGHANVYVYADEGDDDADKWKITSLASSSSFYLQNYSGGSWENSIYAGGGGAVKLSYDNSWKLETTSTGVTVSGSVTDDKGNLRSIPNVDKSSAHTVSAANAGRAIYISSGGVTVPNSVMSAGDAVTIINNSGSDQTITQGSGLTMYNTADASTGNRTLAGRGMATIWFHSASTAYISGAGLS